MITLFSQEYAVKSYAEDLARIQVCKNTVEMCQEFGTTFDEAVQKLMTKFGLRRDDALEYAEEYWKKEQN